MKILFAEDDLDSRQIIARFLRSNGHEVDEFAMVEESINSAMIKFYDVLITDYKLLDGTGQDIVKFVKPYGTRTISISGMDSHDLYGLGFDAILTKPLNLMKLLSTVTQVWQK